MTKKSKYQRRFHIGIDIGKKGGIVIQERDCPILTFPMPMIKTELDYLELYRILENYEAGNGIVVFEKLGVIFGTSKSTAFSMGHQAGAIEMACVALAIPFVKVPAKEWQKEMFTGVDEVTRSSKAKSGKSRDTKAMALVAAKRLFPREELKFGGRTTVPHDGLVDALLMSEYAKRKYT